MPRGRALTIIMCAPRDPPLCHFGGAVFHDLRDMPARDPDGSLLHTSVLCRT